MRKKLILLAIFVLGVLQLAGCTQNQKENSGNTSKTQVEKQNQEKPNIEVQSGNQQAIQVPTPAEIPEVAENAPIITGEQLKQYFENQIKEKKDLIAYEKLGIDGNIVVAFDPACKLPYCDVDQLIAQFATLGLSGDISKVDIATNDNLKNFVTKTQIGLPFVFISANKYDKLKKENNQIVAILDQVGYQTQDGYILPIFFWQYGQENICDDGIDNDQDGKIDTQDEDCKQVIILSDSRCKLQGCNLNNLVEGLKSSLFIVGYFVAGLDYTTDDGKKVYDQFVKGTSNPYLPVSIFTEFPLPEIGLSIITSTPEMLYKKGDYYILLLGKLWDPINQKQLVQDIQSNDNQDSQLNKQKLNQEQIQAILQNSYIKGDLNKAEIIWLEYSDLECPYCARQHKSGNIDYILNKYGDKVAFVFQHFPLSFHKYAEKGAIAAECVAKLAGNDSNKFYSYIENIYNAGQINDNVLINQATKLGIDETALKKCLKSKEIKQKIYNQMQQGQKLFNITGTPGNVFVNLKTGEFVVVSGAYPKEKFEQVIDSLMNK